MDKPKHEFHAGHSGKPYFDKSMFENCIYKWGDLEGKMLEMHYGYEKPFGSDKGCYCLIGLDKETNTRYVLAFETK